MDDETKYPSAQVTDPSSWDPLAKLEELKNAPKLLLQKKSPPSPLPLTKGSPRSPGTLLVSSSVPVPQLPFHITAYQDRHYHRKSQSSGFAAATARLNAPGSGTSSSASDTIQSFPSPSLSSVSSNSTVTGFMSSMTINNNTGGTLSPLRPIARRYSHNSTQTDPVDVSDVATQSEDEDYEDFLKEKQSASSRSYMYERSDEDMIS